ncbi:MAG TPA: L,D-transpeptidase family protein [Candidatus Binatia bacterium]|jgi:hypothetical protein|nr:L,D-transpeptidase family protein [Candidatus Binatia bacterium]
MFVRGFRQYAAFLIASAFVLTSASPVLAAPDLIEAKVIKRDAALFRWPTLSKPPEQVLKFPLAVDGAKPGSLAFGDVGNDGVQEIVAGAAPSALPMVNALRLDGSSIFSFAAYGTEERHGVSVAVGDLDGDGGGEIVTGSGPGMPAHVRVLDATAHEVLAPGGFYPYGQEFRGGVNVAVGDLDGDGKDEIVTSPGPTGGPRVMIWSGRGALLGDFFAFDDATTAGLNVAVGDLDGDGRAEIITALAANAPATVRVFSGFDGFKTADFLAIAGGFEGGLNLASGDLDGDGKAEIIAVPAGGGGPHVHAFDVNGRLVGNFFAYDEPYRGGVLIAVGKLSDGKAVLAVAPADRGTLMRPELPEYIYVDISEQRLRAYEYGRLVRTFLVATGMAKYPTPLGEYSVLDKPYKVNYRWSYGPGNPDNYDLGWVTWNLRIMPHKYIHYAPWRKVFGIRGSHGCVNVSKADAQWIYGWADLGTPVSIRQ